MQWQHIPEPLDIRPCQKPKELKARQLVQHPVKLKNLPEWVTHASFQTPQKLKSPIDHQTCGKNNEKNEDSQTFQSLQQKYNKKERFKKIFQRQQNAWVFQANFAFQFISGDYVELFEQKCYNSHSNSGKNKIKFDSCFECGNLDKVYQKMKQKQFKDEDISQTEQEYHLMMQNDINTQGYTQWFFFSVFNSYSQNTRVILKIVNFLKAFSLYKIGMKPWIITKNQRIWKPIDTDIFYTKTNVKNDFGESFYMVQFEIQLQPGQCFISMMPVYSYSRLCDKIKGWEKVDGMLQIQKKNYSLLNNIVPVLEYIPKNQNDQMIQQEKKWLDTLVFSARTHPGEVWSSFAMESLIENVILFHKNVSEKNSSIRYIFVPMINPDGVIYGNFRCDFSGVDLNRVWLNPNKYTQPSIFQLKKYFLKQFQKKKAKYFIDFHSHSKNLNVFAYACGQNILEGRLLPDLIRLANQNKIFDVFPNNQEINTNFINTSQTAYISSKQILASCKKSTARAFMSQVVEKANAITIEISFYGYQPNKLKQKTKVKIFQLTQFKEFSWLLVKNLNAYINSTQSVMIAKKMLKSLYHRNQKIQIQRQFFFGAQNVKQNSSQLEFINNQNEDSQSQPEKYYTAQTKRKKHIKQRQGKKYGKNLMIERKKGYLKKTQSIVNKFQGLQRNKQKSAFENINGKESKKPTQSQLFAENRSRNVSFESSNKKPIQQKISPKKVTQDIKKTFEFRQKNISHRKLKGFTQEKNDKSPSSDEHTKNKTSKSFVEAVDMSNQISNKVIPTFGMFLPTNKRNQYRRHKTINKQIMVYRCKKTEGLKHIKTELNEDDVFGIQKRQKKINQQVFINMNAMAPCTVQKTKNSCRNLKNLNNSKEQSFLYNKKQQNQTRNYLDQRSRILEMMKKQTRIYGGHVENQIKEELNSEGIEGIVPKRKRAKTEYEDHKDVMRFEDKNIFMKNKILPQKLKNISRKIQELKMRQMRNVHSWANKNIKK